MLDCGSVPHACLGFALHQDELPYNDFFEYYGPDYRLHITPSNMENKNERKYLEDTKVRAAPPLAPPAPLLVVMRWR